LGACRNRPSLKAQFRLDRNEPELACFVQTLLWAAQREKYLEPVPRVKLIFSIYIKAFKGVLLGF
jgi:hypothetical protein